MLRIQIVSVLLWGWVSIKAQNTLFNNDEYQKFSAAVELMQKEKYGAARQAFERYLSSFPESIKSEDAQYYRALCALNLYHPDAESLYTDFIQKYDYHPKAGLAYFELGNFYFIQEDYQKANQYFEQVPLAKLDQNLQLETRFKSAYGYFGQQQFDKALEKFNQIKTTSSKYSAAASYYAGYIEYRNGDYDQALLDLTRAESEDSYAALVPYLVANVYYKQGRYDELLKYTEKVLGESGAGNYLELYLLAGEAYYFKQDYLSAAEHYNTYSVKSKRQLPPDTQYKLAYALYATGEYDLAQEKFKTLASREEEVGQFASYYLGEVYLRAGNLNYASSSYLKASQDNYNSDIQEAAGFKYAKVQYELGNFAQAIEGLQEFLASYPASEFGNEAGDLLSEAFLSTNNYQQAIEHLERLDIKSARARKTYQKVTYYQGTQFFNNGKYFSAVQMFEKSLGYPIDQEMVLLANYWTAEAYSIGKKYPQAIAAYLEVLKDQGQSSHEKYIRSRYGLGYAYYNTEQYQQALNQFSAFLESYQERDRFLDDALIRVADCHYVLKDYQLAVDRYQQAIRNKSHDQDYALFQQGTVLSIQGDRPRARGNFSLLIGQFPESRFADDAVYQRAQLDLETSKYQEAVNGFTRVINDFQTSVLVPYAYTKRAQAYYNLKQYDKTLGDYQTVLAQYTNHESAHDALIGLQETLNLLNRSSEFDQYFTSYKTANPDNASLANIEYETAVNLYLSEDYDIAIQKFQSFINTHPGHNSVYEARFYIAESFYRSEDNNQAIEYYQQVVEDNRINQVNRARRRLGDLWFEQGQFSKSIQAYHQLEEAARTKKENYYAWSGLMESYLAEKDYTKADLYATKILDQGGVNVNAVNRSMLIRGKVAYHQGDLQTATDHFLSTLNTAQDENGAEAQYMLAKIQFDQGQYKQSNETLYDLNNRFGTYGYWMGKSFLLITDNYVGLDELFQARATLKSIIENAPEQEIVEEAKLKLAALEERDPAEVVSVDSVEIEVIDN
ncbi:MAG: hypothetical protein DHS20C17_29450 [Cyclobacteriaceae bacterium]|nr:MAG: hypothetical protein DHS20C17_29450 [Cyclobacteriaceae bacterium]